MSIFLGSVRRLVIMGPSGCGKSTLAQALAQSLDWHFVEGDSLHPQVNVEKMRSGRPLDDSDRIPWLEAVAAALEVEKVRGIVITCSALKRSYRDQLRAAVDPLLFIMPNVPRDVLAQRLATRAGHYMPAKLLDSQLADLELLAEDEHGFIVDGRAPLSEQLEQIRSKLMAESSR